MREAGHFFYFRDKVLPYLKSVVNDKDLRIWSAGCSTGEEPYTLAIIMEEFLGKENKIIYDSFMRSMQIGFAKGAIEAFCEAYDKAIKHGIIVSLE
jgi:hypothetical protein